jgi:hypothetical protein
LLSLFLIQQNQCISLIVLKWFASKRPYISIWLVAAVAEDNASGLHTQVAAACMGVGGQPLADWALLHGMLHSGRMACPERLCQKAGRRSNTAHPRGSIALPRDGRLGRGEVVRRAPPDWAASRILVPCQYPGQLQPHKVGILRLELVRMHSRKPPNTRWHVKAREHTDL